jgi:hypothetical protein
MKALEPVIPAQAGIHVFATDAMGPRPRSSRGQALRGDDKRDA